jgi:hypothetical protein
VLVVRGIRLAVPEGPWPGGCDNSDPAKARASSELAGHRDCFRDRRFQHGNFIRLLPRKIQIGTAKMSVGRHILIESTRPL